MPDSEPEGDPLRLLLLEDNSDDAAMVIRTLRKSGFGVIPTIVTGRDEFTTSLRIDPDVIISDHALPEFSAFEALRIVADYNDSIPFIIVSGAIREEAAVEAMRQGAADYLLKDRLTRLGEAVRRALEQRKVRDERREARIGIELSEARYRLLAEHATDLISRHAPDGTYLYASPASRRLLGLEPGELVGRSAIEFVHPDDAHAFDSTRPWGSSLVPITYRHRRKDDEYIWFETTSTIVSNEAGDVGEIVSVSRDVSERKRYELELIAARDEAEAMSRLKTAFLANMSHEIRTPLTAIIGFAELLAEYAGGESLEYSRLIRESGTRLLETLNSVLDLAQLEGGHVKMDIRSVQIDLLLAQLLDVFHFEVEKRHLTLRMQKVSSGSVRARADAPALSRVLANLISNGLKFTEAGGVIIRYGSVGSEAFIEVEDSGIGIDEVFLLQLFDEFTQESSGLARTHEGIGLGLSIARRLVDLMNGRIEVVSAKGVGSRFTVFVPLAS